MYLDKDLNIAYIILAHGSPQVLDRFILSLNEYPNNVKFFIHLDAKADFQKFDNIRIKWDNVQFIPNRVNVQWAGFSMVKAVLLLMEYAIKNSDFDRLVLLSGVDYPIVSNSSITDYFNKHSDVQFINSVTMPHPHKPIWRVTKYHLEGGTVRGQGFLNNIKRKMNDWLKGISHDRNYLKYLPKKVLCGGSTWFSLTRDCVTDILDFVNQSKGFVRFFKYTAHADEMFFQTVIVNMPTKYKILPGLTYTDWSQSKPPYPAIISHKHIKDIKNEIFSDNGYNQTDYLFARKFDENDISVFDEIDAQLRIT